MRGRIYFFQITNWQPQLASTQGSPPFRVCFDNLGLSQVCVPGYIKYYGDKVGLVAAVYVRMGAAYHRLDQQDRAVHCLDNADKIYR